MNKIELKFDKSLSGLAGNAYGLSEYEAQVKDKFDWNDKNEIIFPENIVKIGISFIQGFFSVILDKINKNDIEKYLIIKSSSSELTNKIIENIKF